MRNLRSVALTAALPLVWGLCALLPGALPTAAQTPAQPPAPGAPSPLPPRPHVTALAISEPIHVDGVLDEDVWQRAEPATHFVQREPATGAPATEDTIVKVAYTHSTLYIAIEAFTERPEDVVANEMQRDSQLYRDDSVILLLDTFHDHRNAFWFETNANGSRTDALVTDEGRDFNVQWDAVWDVAARRTHRGWTAEVAIPFASLRFDPNNDTWGFNVRRLVRYKGEEDYWSPMPLEGNPFRVSLAGELTGIHPPPPSLNLRVKPFGVAETSTVNTPFGKVNDDRTDAGLDVKWGIRRNMTLDLTYNTDFADTEVDDQQINLTRFSLFFPEKREFFLENYGLFEFGFNSPGTPLLKPFFSRRIGISRLGTVVPIDWGARLTGREGPWSVGLLDVQTRQTTVAPGFNEPDNNWGVVRLKRNIGDRSTIGLIATNRDAGNGDVNRVVGLDTSLYATNQLAFSGFYTESQDPGHPARDPGGSWAGGARAAWSGPIWNWTFDAVQVGTDYDPQAGFLLRNGIRRYYPNVVFEPRPQIPGLLNLHFAFAGDIVTDLDNRIETRSLSADVAGIRTRSQDQLTLFVDSTLDRVPFPFSIGPGVTIAPGEYSFNDVGLNYYTNDSRMLSASGYVVKGNYYGGTRFSSLADVIVRASRHLRFDTIWQRDALDLPGGSFTSNIIRERVGISVTPNLSTNAYIQYNDLGDLLSLNLRFNWTYLPGSDIYLVFNQNWQTQTLSNLMVRDRAVILKLTYLLQL
jgi:Domain of unknown function (DUF5916)/Carbohydrate family 9 binding domain-like